MTPSARRISAGMIILLAGVTLTLAAAQTGNVPLSPEAWIATDSIRSVCDEPGRAAKQPWGDGQRRRRGLSASPTRT